MRKLQPINGEEFRQGDDDDGDTSGMESDFDEVIRSFGEQGLG